jgi:hypothetical protein
MSVGQSIIDTYKRKVITMKYEYGYKAYVAEDGNYGVESIITFDYELFVDKFPKAWAMLDDIHEYSRVDFIVAVLDEDEEMLTEFANDYEFDLSWVRP